MHTRRFTLARAASYVCGTRVDIKMEAVDNKMEVVGIKMEELSRITFPNAHSDELYTSLRGERRLHIDNGELGSIVVEGGGMRLAAWLEKGKWRIECLFLMRERG